MNDIPNLTSPREVVALLSRYNLSPRQRLGQNFLIDGNIVNKIIAAADLKPGEAVLEIGPGAGALTIGLALQKVRVVALELDGGFVKLLKDLMRQFPHVTVIPGDALKADFHRLIENNFSFGENVTLISNLPYYLSSPLMYRLFEQKFPFSRAVLMFQQEVARRILAEPGDPRYGSLTVLGRYYTTGSFLFKVSKQVFWPRPDVESAVISLKVRSPSLFPAEEVLLRQIVKSAFQQRRKSLVKSISNLFPWNREVVSALLKEAAIEPGCRPESLSVAEFAKLTRIIYNYMRYGSGI